MLTKKEEEMPLRNLVLLLVLALGCKGKPLLLSEKRTQEKPKPGPKKDARVERPKFVFDAGDVDCSDLPGRNVEYQGEKLGSIYKAFFEGNKESNEPDKIFKGKLVDAKLIYSQEKDECDIYRVHLIFKVEIPILNSYVGERVSVGHRRGKVIDFFVEKKGNPLNCSITGIAGHEGGPCCFDFGDEGILFVKRVTVPTTHESYYRFISLLWPWPPVNGWWKIKDGKIIGSDSIPLSYFFEELKDINPTCVIKELFEIKEGKR
jgi:hypothetical protein